MKTKITYQIKLILAFTIIIQNLAVACSCWPYESVFCRIVSEGRFIVRAVVTDHPDYDLMEVQIIENLNREITEETIIIQGQDGFNCAEGLNGFGIQDTLILALETGEVNTEIKWYLEGACGLHFLRYEDGIVMGQITDSLTIQPIQDFRDHLFECMDMTVPVKEIEDIKRAINIPPNPISDKFQISSLQNPIDGYEVYNSNGQLIIFEVLAQSIERYEINSSQLENGMYYISVSKKIT